MLLNSSFNFFIPDFVLEQKNTVHISSSAYLLACDYLIWHFLVLNLASFTNQHVIFNLRHPTDWKKNKQRRIH